MLFQGAVVFPSPLDSPAFQTAVHILLAKNEREKKYISLLVVPEFMTIEPPTSAYDVSCM